MRLNEVVVSKNKYLKANRLEYYDRLTAVRNRGQWEEWLKFFLAGVTKTARAATQTAREIVALRETHRGVVHRDAKAFRRCGFSTSSTGNP